MVSNCVNFNFEYDLYKVPVPSWMERVLRPSMECLYFYCNETLPLASDIKYESSFLEKVEGRVVTPGPETNLWWGQISPISALSNCKIANHAANQQLGLWTPAGGVAHTWQEVDQLMGPGRWRLKDPWMMGGTGQWRINRELLHDPSFKKGIESRLKKGPLLLEQTLEIEAVLGTTFLIDEDSPSLLFTIENHLNSQGNFLGGVVVETPKAIEKELKAMAHYWFAKGARGLLEIDSFKLQKDWYPCVEVNHRRTMGWFIWCLDKKLGKGRLSLNESGGIKLNPVSSPLSAYWLKL